MNINKILSTLTLAAAVLTGATSCDNIGEDERYIELDKIQPKRAVLLEEFTGQFCTNCPQGHAIVHQLLEQYGDAFIPVSIHAGQLAIPEDPSTSYMGLATATGNEYYANANSPALPSGIVDGRGTALNRDQWAAAVRTALETEAPAEIELTPTLDKETGTMTVNVELRSTRNLECTLQVWVLENGIHTVQLDNGTYVADYEHNHVFRAAVNGKDGEAVTVTQGVFFDKTYTHPLSSWWNTDNIYIVAFIRDSSGVLQAAQATFKTTDKQE